MCGPSSVWSSFHGDVALVMFCGKENLNLLLLIYYYSMAIDKKNNVWSHLLYIYMGLKHKIIQNK